MMEIIKSIRCKLIGLTKRKLELLNREYDNFQHYLKTGQRRKMYNSPRRHNLKSQGVAPKMKNFIYSLKHSIVGELNCLSG